MKIFGLLHRRLYHRKTFCSFRYDDEECPDKLWWLFLLSSAVFPATILMILGIWRAIAHLIERRHPSGYQAVRQVPPNFRDRTRNGSYCYGPNINPRDSIAVNLDDVVGGTTIRGPVAEPETPPDGMHWSTSLRKAAGEIVSAQSLTGKIAVNRWPVLVKLESQICLWIARNIFWTEPSRVIFDSSCSPRSRPWRDMDD